MSTSIRDLKPLLAFVARYDAAARASLALWVSGRRSPASGLSRQSTETAATVTTAVVAWLSGRFSELGRNEHFLLFLLSTVGCDWDGDWSCCYCCLLFGCCWLCEPADNSNVSPENTSLPPYAPPLSLSVCLSPSAIFAHVRPNRFKWSLTL